MPKYSCLDKDGNLLAVIYADDEAQAKNKAPTGTVTVEEKAERPRP